MKISSMIMLLPLAAMFAFCRTETKTPKVESTTETVDIKAASDNAKRAEVLAFAKKYMGTKYCYAGGNPEKGFDCSGFVNFVYKHFDIDLPRSSSGFAKIGKSLKPEDFKVGDVLVFYGYRDSKSVGHVGIVSEANGMKSKFIHASSGKEMAVTISELGSDMYTKRFYRCINPFEI